MRRCNSSEIWACALMSKGVGRGRAGELGGDLRRRGDQRLARQQLDLDRLLVELQQPDHLLLVIADAVTLRAGEKTP